MSLGVLVVLTIAGTTALYYTSANSRSAQYSKASESAYSLAEAGIAQSLSILNAALDPRTGTLLPTTTVTYPEGSYTYSGTLGADYIWTITSIGKVTNPDGSNLADATRTLTRKVEIRGLMNGATVGAWSRIYHDNPSVCMTVNTVTLVESVSSRGDLCLTNGASILGAETKVSVGDDVTLTGTTDSETENAGAGAGWTSSGNITSSNNSDATASVSGGGQSADLNGTSFGFAVPSNAVITGIRARVERAASTSGRISDRDVLLLKAGSPSGNDKAAGGTWGTSDSTITYGGSGDLWGTTWTPAQVNASNFGLRFRVQNSSGGSVTASVDYVEITVYYTIPPGSIGTVGTPVDSADIAGHCTLAANPAHQPCSSADNVFADEITLIPPDLTKPTIDMAYWYQNAKPGPMNNCTGGGSFPGGFDNNTTYNNSRTGSDEITPTGTSYTCQWKDAGNNLIGEISWNHTTHVLKVKGTIFVDGDFRFDDDGQLVNYQGRAIIYAAGNIEFDEIVCAGGDGNDNCITNGMDDWDPTQNMLIILSGYDSEYDQGGTQSQSEPSGFQGIVYAKDDCTIHENFHTSGPLICDQILLPSSGNGWPTYYTWPDLGTLVEGQMYGAVSTAPDFELVLAGQSG
jgi:hypothetical protein